MGLLSFLGPSSPGYSDKVWKASEFCLRGMMTDALQAITEGKTPIVTTHFSDNQERIIQFLTFNNVPHFLINSGNAVEAMQQSQVVYVMSPKLLHTNEVADVLSKFSQKKAVSLFFYGHYPLPKKENKLLEKISTFKSPITFYSSLDEPSFEIFGSAQIASIMDKLGVKDDEAIEHAMVSKAMQRARLKIEESVKFDQESASEKEWFQKNAKR